MAVRRPAMIAVMTTLPEASANERCSWASRARNSSGVRSAASIASITACAAAVDLQAQERRHAALRGGDDDGSGCRSRAGAGADESHHLEHPQRLTHAGAAAAE